MKRDVHYRRAKAEGYRARSAYKLIEIIEEHKILDGVTNAVDLCAAPGSWSQVLAMHLLRGKIFAVDIQTIEPIDGVVVIQGDITAQTTVTAIVEGFDAQADLVLCDGAPEVTGLHDLDEYFQASLIQASCSICRQILSPKGTFVTKVFTGDAPSSLLRDLKDVFETVRIVKPKSSRVASKEAFAICTDMFSVFAN
ncbi:tRNA (cytidine32/guanosine34-2'-O)-methyltransferase [Nematocida displodere]|uniref:tRNA (Cytidine32/guanosine34-2'-O)-methyltransferase n=1 Tax=Nematocida displodere TaxID=1805483 RepID=A0A177ECB2_9MICR|nr:tRNA (cytidine32/guanosine34-2'-O)-methyltransferase [Nematocida displodere]